jgi:methylenetetrahydrofolate dehydrogenase (NADP+)/methenyltetrahydrofolate cyclohydrolase
MTKFTPQTSIETDATPYTAQIIDGNASAKRLLQQLAQEIVTEKLTPGLAAVLVGDDPASLSYVGSKARDAQEIGIKSWTHHLSGETTQAELLALVEQLNNDKAVHGILVQLPLPPQIDKAAIIAAIHPDKDVDGFTQVNLERLERGEAAFVPCTPQGIMIVLREVMPDLAGKKAVVLGRSHIVGKPVAQLLRAAGCEVAVGHRGIPESEIPGLCRTADILVVAIGVPGHVRGDWIKPGAVVIDVGVTRITDPATGKNKLVGDVNFAEVSKVARAMTKVTGGIGPMTRACLMRNTVQSAKRHKALEAT